MSAGNSSDFQTSEKFPKVLSGHVSGSVLVWWLHADHLSTLRSRRNGRHFPDAIFRLILLSENVWILIRISLGFVPVGPINNIPALFRMMAWRRPGDGPLSEPRMFYLLTHICGTRPQWVKWLLHIFLWMNDDLMSKIWDFSEHTSVEPSPGLILWKHRHWFWVVAWCLVGNRPIPELVLTVMLHAIVRHLATINQVTCHILADFFSWWLNALCTFPWECMTTSYETSKICCILGLLLSIKIVIKSASVGGSGLVPDRWKVIPRTNVDRNAWHNIVSPGYYKPIYSTL